MIKTSTSTLTNLLEQADQFKHLTPPELQEITAAGQIVHFDRDQVIYLEGEACAGMHVLLEGQVQLCKTSRQGQVAILAVFEPVIMFNEVAALDQGPNPATAIAGAPSLVWRIPAEGYQAILLRYPHLGLAMARVMAQRNRLLLAQVEDLAFRSVVARTARLLFDLSRRGGQAIDRRQHPNYRLAARISTVPEAFSRALKVLRERGAICSDDGEIQILNATLLAEIAQQPVR